MPRQELARNGPAVPHDEWLESLCETIQSTGRALAETVGEVNRRMEDAQSGHLGRRQPLTETQLRTVEEACQTLRQVQRWVQNALFDCEHEIRELREREVSPAELLIDGDRLIGQYRFLRRRARIIDGLLAYLPGVNSHAALCLDHLRRVPNGDTWSDPLTVPDCAFALAALEQLREEAGGT